MAKIVSVDVVVFRPDKNRQKGFVGANDEAKRDKRIRTSTANPLLIYPEADEADYINRAEGGEVAVKVTCDNGVYGWGGIGGYRSVPAWMIIELLGPVIIGMEAREIEKIWDVMFKAALPIGRKGAAIEAISGIDVALWDIFGKETGQPVYKLLGGKVRDKIKVYPTSFQADECKAAGYTDIKIPMPYSFMHGEFGMQENEKLVAHARDVFGPDGFIALECYMGWNEEYTMKMAERLQQYNIRWIEEPVVPDSYETYARLRKRLHKMGIMISGGEHEFTRWGAKDLIENGCVDILQLDIGRAGGITEMKKVLGLAAAYDIMVIPHDHGAYRTVNYHLTINSIISPIAENLVVRGIDSERMFLPEPMIQPDGHVYLTDAPGFGYDINWDFREKKDIFTIK